MRSIAGRVAGCRRRRQPKPQWSRLASTPTRVAGGAVLPQRDNRRQRRPSHRSTGRRQRPSHRYRFRSIAGPDAIVNDSRSRSGAARLRRFRAWPGAWSYGSGNRRRPTARLDRTPRRRAAARTVTDPRRNGWFSDGAWLPASTREAADGIRPPPP